MKKKWCNILSLCACAVGMFFILTGCENNNSVNQYDGTKMGNGSGVVIDENDTTGVTLEVEVYDTEELTDEPTPDATVEYVDVESFDIPNDAEP